MAVYTEVTDDEVSAFANLYDIGGVMSFKGIAEGVENSNYLLQTTTAVYILTLYEKRVAPADLPFFLGLMEHLAAKGVPCPTPIQALDGKTLHELSGRPAALISFLPGLSVKRSQPHHAAGVGEALARLHMAGGDFAMVRANNLSVAGWRGLAGATATRADEVRPGLAGEIAAEIAEIAAHWPTALPQGVIHADLFPDNVFFIGERLSGLIDFYFACNDLFAYDIAICLNAWCFERDNSFNATKARQLLSSYQRVRRLEPDELEALPLLARGSALRFLLTRLYDWFNQPAGALVTPKDPIEYLNKLRFHRTVRSPAAYGLAG
ncbi:MAG: homoserine kinase [Alphaproteobacteria bacterium]|nr:homoserine kinase [Alphaproteobacteria bacterium]